MNPMRNVRVEKITLNVGAGKDQRFLEKAMTVLKTISGVEAKKTITQRRIASWGLRPGLPIGCMITLRGKKALDVLPKLLAAKEKTLESRHFDTNGNVAFGIQEHIDIGGVQYDPKIGVIGLQVCVTLERPGYHIKRRRLNRTPVGKTHRVTKTDAMDFMKTSYEVTVKGAI